MRLDPAPEGIPRAGGDHGSVVQERAQLEALEQPSHGDQPRGSADGLGGRA